MPLTPAELTILGLVLEKPSHGYELEQLIELRGIRNWTELGFSSIYYLLGRLEKRGLVTADAPSRAETGAGRSGNGAETRAGAGAEAGAEARSGTDTEAAAGTEAGAEAGAGTETIAGTGTRPASPKARRVFRPTAAGRAAAAEATLAMLSSAQPTFSPFLTALAHRPLVDGRDFAAALDRRREALAAQIAAVQAAQAAQRPLPPHVKALFDYSLTLMQAEKAWLDRKDHA